MTAPEPVGNARIAADLAAMGLSVFPCYPSGDQVKKPMPNILWRSVATSDRVKVAGWWKRWPEALVGINLAKSGLIVIDADRHGEHDGVAAIAELMHEHQFDPNDVPVVGTPNSGTHFYFRQRPGESLGNARGTLPPGIDVRGDGGYTIAPGSVLSDGRRYEGFGSILDAPTLPDWLATIITASSKPAPGRVPVPVSDRPSDERVAAYVDAALEQELEAVRSAPKGTRNEQLNRSAFALGQLVGAGWIAEASVSAMLENAAAGLAKEDGPLAVRKTIASGLRSGMRQPRQMPESSFAAPDDGYDASKLRVGERIDPETGEITDMGIPISEAAQPMAGLYDGTDWLHPDGLMGEMVEWILRTARRPNRPLAVASAIATMAGACARHLATPERGSTHLYVAMVGDSFVGKDRPLKAAGTMLEAARIDIATTGKFKSDAGIEALLRSRPANLATVDEMGQNIFARIGRRNGSSHEDGISSMLRELWNVNFDHFSTSQSAQNPSDKIYAPSLTILGASTPEEFYKSLAGGSLENGFLNRFLVIKAAKRSAPADVVDDPRDVPASIIKKLRALLPTGGGNFQDDTSCFVINTPFDYTLMRWQSDVTRRRFRDMEERLIEVAQEDRDFGGVVGRTAEMALRLATLHAASRDGRFAILIDRDLDWGIAVATCSAATMAEDARDRIAENDSQRNYNRIRQVIREAGPSGISKRELTRKLRGSIIGKPFDDAIKALVEGGVAAAFEIPPTSKGGRPSHRFKLL